MNGELAFPRLEIGSGSNPQPGYLHLDCRAGLPHLDVLGDLRAHLPFREGSVEEILSHSSVEHVSWRSIRETLADWYRVLKPGGRAIIYTPDFHYLCRMYLEGKTDTHLDVSYVEKARELFGACTPAAWAMIKMFAGQEYPENFHYAAYDFDMLKSLLEGVGFRRITRIPPDYSLRVVAMKPPEPQVFAGAAELESPGISGFMAAEPRERVSVARSPGSGLVHVNLVDRGWILERMGRELERHLDYVTVGDSPDPSAALNYHINYHAFTKKNNLDAALFTHVEESVPSARDRFFDVARSVDVCVCMSKKYHLVLTESGVRDVVTIMPGTELERFTPSLRIGVAGRTYHTGRKGESLVAKAMAIPGTEWYFAGEGWPQGGTVFSSDRLPEFYRIIDVLLVPALYEGGPMPVLEALASGKPVIAPPVGFVPQFPHIEYQAGNFEELRNRIEEFLRQRLELRASVEERTWKAWAMEHHLLFSRLLPQRTELRVRAVDETPPGVTGWPVPFAKLPGYTCARRKRAAGDRLKILLVARAEQFAGGPSVRIPILRRQLSEMGHEVDFRTDPEPDATGYDVAHIFNVWAPWDALRQMRSLKKSGVPLILSPIFLDLAENAWAGRAAMLIFSPDNPSDRRTGYLQALADGSLMLDNRSRFQGFEIFKGADAMIREIVTLADHLVVLSVEEMQRISKTLRVSRCPFTLVRNAADHSLYENADPGWFTGRYGIRDFVLCAGRIERRKNQALLLHAMRDGAFPVVLVGSNSEPDYERVCRSLATSATHFIPHLEREELASAYAAARVFVQPSWAEGASLAALEAAAAGCSLVVSNRSSEFEYFGDGARYCDPADTNSIRDSVHEAHASFELEKPAREALRARLRETCTWESAAEGTLEAYYRAIREKE